MKRYRIPVIETCYGFVEVEAKDEQEAVEKAYCLEDDYFVHKSNVEVFKEELERIES